MSFENDPVDIINDPEAAAEMAMLLSRRPQSRVIILHEFDSETKNWIDCTVFRDGKTLTKHNYRILPMRWPDADEYQPQPQPAHVLNPQTWLLGRAGGFSLVELLIVIVVVSIFALTIMWMVKKAFWIGIYLAVALAIGLVVLSIFRKK